MVSEQCLNSVWMVSEQCLISFWMVYVRWLDDFWMMSVSGPCLDYLWTVSELCLDCVWTVSGLCLNCVWTVSGRCLDFIRALSEPTIDSVLTVSSHSPGHVLTVSVLTVSGPCLLFNPLKSRKPRKKLKSWHKRWTQKWLPGIKFSSRQSVFSAQFYSEYHLSMHARILIFFLLTFEGVKHLWCRQKFVFELTKTSSYTHRKKLTMTGSL